MPLKYDFHMHSICSDGSFAPTELLDMAIDTNLAGFALTDHDCIDGLKPIFDANTSTTQFYAGVEVSCQWQKPNRFAHQQSSSVSIHVVGLGITKLKTFNGFLQQIQQQRVVRAQQIAQKLQNLGFGDVWEEINQQNLDVTQITRTHFANYLVQKDIVNKHQQAFDRFLAKGKPAYVALEGVSIPTAIQQITECGGMAILAHPTRYQLSSTAMRQLIEFFKHSGGQGIELPSIKEVKTQHSYIDRLAQINELMVSTGSDFHGVNTPWIRLGDVPELQTWQQGILHNLQPVQAVHFES